MKALIRGPIVAKLGAVATAALCLVAQPREASACGACFAPPGPPTVVSGHRMVMSISMTQTVLWDQIQYSGDPADFAWVLPVKPGARIEAGTDAFFEVLEAQTSVRIAPAQVQCGGGGSSGIGCGTNSQGLAASDESGDGGDYANGGSDPVQVLHEGTVGPYETVTLSTEQPGALNDWLEQHGYNVDDASQPIIDGYVKDGFDFIALRLQPGQGVKQMTPVRVVMGGGTFSLPLRMVAIGTGASTPIVLYVIGEGRYETKEMKPVVLSNQLLSWDFTSKESNYTDLRDYALKKNEGKSALTAFAQQDFFEVQSFNANFDSQTFLDLYVNQAKTNGEADASCTAALPGSDGRIKNPCPPDEPWSSPACGAVGPEEIDARKLGCQGAEDVSVALDGMYLSSAWVTRLEMVLPKAALASDLTVQASEDQAAVSNVLQAQIAVHPEDACPGGVAPMGIGPTNGKKDSNNRYTPFLIGTIAALAAALRLRRARAKHAS